MSRETFKSELLSHSQLKVRVTQPGETGDTKMAAVCTDKWHGPDSRCDDVVVNMREGQAKAAVRLLCLFSIRSREFALVPWFFPAVRDKTRLRPVLISKLYSQQLKLTSPGAADVMDIKSIQDTVHMIQDLQARPKVLKGDLHRAERYFTRDSNMYCL